ncbi:MAG: hypothetical protein R3A47_10060 [Polyangiales bacterium]
MKNHLYSTSLLLSALALSGCGDDSKSIDFENAAAYSEANQCVLMRIARNNGAYLAESSNGFEFSASAETDAAKLYLKPAGLGTYLLYDADRQYLTSDDVSVGRAASLMSDTNVVDDEIVIDDNFVSEGLWDLGVVSEASGEKPAVYALRHHRSGLFLADAGLTDSISNTSFVWLEPTTGCAEFPELSIDATGTVAPPTFDDGSLFGYVDTHEHILTNFAFGGGGVFHGAPFHPLGVEHALGDCNLSHGVDGRADILGFAFDGGVVEGFSISEFVPVFATGLLDNPSHSTNGYPEFTDWPNAPFSSTHQMQYYKWIERAYLSGLRLVVQHVTGNQVLCDLMRGLGQQPMRYTCNEMFSADRIIEETHNMEAYIDAQVGGPGMGWFRIVKTPEEARAIVAEGKMAVILGIETSNLFDCFLVRRDGDPVCDEAYVVAQLDEYYEKGIRALFPMHKYDNAFSAGDGHRGIIDLGNAIQTGHYSNYGPCDETIAPTFDHGPIMFPMMNMPRAEYDSEPPFDFSGIGTNPLATIFPVIGLLDGDPIEGDFCQQAGLTDLGEFLIREIMKRGMILEIDHLPRLSRKRAMELMAENDYPASASHGQNSGGFVYEMGGVSKSGFDICRDPNTPATVDDGYQARIQLMRDKGAFPAEGLGLDLNGFAGARGPRFGSKSDCVDQTDPVTYPFTSYAGDITFTEPHVGNRTLDFNTEGLVHIGLLPEMIEDVRNDGVTDEELEPFFKSAEGYIRMWEKSEARGAALR